jgi:hypothetical protein
MKETSEGVKWSSKDEAKEARKKLKMIYVTINFNYNARVYSIIDEREKKKYTFIVHT